MDSVLLSLPTSPSSGTPGPCHCCGASGLIGEEPDGGSARAEGESCRKHLPRALVTASNLGAHTGGCSLKTKQTRTRKRKNKEDLGRAPQGVSEGISHCCWPGGAPQCVCGHQSLACVAPVPQARRWGRGSELGSRALLTSTPWLRRLSVALAGLWPTYTFTWLNEFPVSEGWTRSLCCLQAQAWPSVGPQPRERQPVGAALQLGERPRGVVSGLPVTWGVLGGLQDPLPRALLGPSC